MAAYQRGYDSGEEEEGQPWKRGDARRRHHVYNRRDDRFDMKTITTHERATFDTNPVLFWNRHNPISHLEFTDLAFDAWEDMLEHMADWSQRS